MKLTQTHIVAIAIGVVLLYLWYKGAKEKGTLPESVKKLTGDRGSTESANTAAPKANTGTPSYATQTTFSFFEDNKVSKKGDSGAAVRALQLEILKKKPGVLPRYGADGRFGDETAAALLQYWTVDRASALYIRNTSPRY